MSERSTRRTVAIGALAVVLGLGVGVLATLAVVGVGGDDADSASEVSADESSSPPPSTAAAPVDEDPTDTQTSTSTDDPRIPSTLSSPDLSDLGPLTDGPFIETFENDTGVDSFRYGVFHRDVDVQSHGDMSGSWEADHDIHSDECGHPHDHTHQIAKADRNHAFYICREHLMTSIGHVDGYSVAWFAPDVAFQDQREVRFDVNSTWLGTRQWWEVAIAPLEASALSCIDFLPCDVPSYHSDAVVVGTRDGQVRVWANGYETTPDWRQMCKGDLEYQLDPEGCESKSIRREWSIVDNEDGTLTINFHTHSWTVDGSFPDEPFHVVIKDHSYTPLKDGPVVGFTWHWDNIIVR